MLLSILPFLPVLVCSLQTRVEVVAISEDDIMVSVMYHVEGLVLYVLPLSAQNKIFLVE